MKIPIGFSDFLLKESTLKLSFIYPQFFFFIIVFTEGSYFSFFFFNSICDLLRRELRMKGEHKGTGWVREMAG